MKNLNVIDISLVYGGHSCSSSVYLENAKSIACRPDTDKVLKIRVVSGGVTVSCVGEGGSFVIPDNIMKESEAMCGINQSANIRAIRSDTHLNLYDV